MIPFRLAPAFLAVAAVAYACGPRPHASGASERSRSVTGPSIVTSLDVRQQGADVAFTFRIANNAKKKLELIFPTGQRYDLTIVDPNGEEIWRWSAGRMFTQALQNRIVAAFDTLTFEMKWKAPATSAGASYTAVAALLSQNHPLEHRADFAVR
ncbi:MAG TPA: BsuPI-related putative proteinase inhibitor [Gemmatimonadaceae bacterium]|nr:BsuPI-related putative proteinase inhibitor [Gemmatimonadaceae bacterium]